MKANAFKNRKKVATHTLQTAGAPEKLALKDERESIANDKEQLIFLTLEVQDEKGVRCPFANDEISVDVNGAGELIGLDSGDQFSHELYKQNKRKAYEGRLLLTIKPKGMGMITVQCRADKLKASTMKFQN